MPHATLLAVLDRYDVSSPDGDSSILEANFYGPTLAIQTASIGNIVIYTLNRRRKSHRDEKPAGILTRFLAGESRSKMQRYIIPKSEKRGRQWQPIAIT